MEMIISDFSILIMNEKYITIQFLKYTCKKTTINIVSSQILSLQHSVLKLRVGKYKRFQRVHGIHQLFISLLGTSLVVLWSDVHLVMQGTGV